MTTSCSQCGAVIHDGSSFCPQCGASASSAIEIVPGEPQPVVAAVDGPAPFSRTLLDETSHLEGIGGWLILVAIGLVLSPFIILGLTLFTLVPVLTMDRVQPFLQSHPAVHALIILEVATNLIFVLLLLWINYLFFSRKKAFPSFMVFYLCFHLMVSIGDFVAARNLLPGVGHQDGMAMTRSLMGAIIWVPYLLISRRVKLTFTR
jgi:hypothetical protein